MAGKVAKLSASKENAKKVQRMVNKLLTGEKLNEADALFVTEFMERAISRLPSAAAIKRNKERKKSNAPANG